MCDRSFRYLSHLVRHQVTHSGKKPHACGECGRAFTRLSTLHHHHQQAPSGEKAFRYQRYGNTFNYSTLLVQHLWIHTQQGRSGARDAGRVSYGNQALETRNPPVQ